MRSRPALFLFLFLSCFSSAQETQPRKVNGVHITFEEDQFLEWFRNKELDDLNEDRNYTLGLGIGLTSPKVSWRYKNWISGRRTEKNDRLSESQQDRDTLIFPTAGWSLKLAGYTPDSLRAKDPVIGDRPYSSVILISLSLHKINVSKLRGNHKTISIGAIGVPGVAEYLQTWIHKQSNEGNTKPPYNPEGWDHQISQGSEPVFLFENGYSILLTKKAIRNEVYSREHKTRFGIDVKADYGYMAGYLAEGFAGLSFRFGMLDLANWDTQLANQIQSLSHIGDDDAMVLERYYSTKTKYEVYLFASATSNIVLYNALLFGQFRHSDYRMNYFDHELFVIHARGGLTLACPYFQVSGYFAVKTAEINVPGFARPHSWFAVSLLGNWGDTKKIKNK